VAAGRAGSTGAELSSVAGSLGIVASGRGGHSAKPEPAQTATESERRWRERRRLGLDVLNVLSELFPTVFRPPSFRPLKLKIHLDLIERAPVTAEEVHAALSIHCRSLPYLRASTEGAVRVDLDGNPAGAVTAEEAANAKARIAAIRQRVKERKAKLAAPSKPTEARQRPSAGSGVPLAPKATKPAPRQPGRPVIDLSRTWKRPRKSKSIARPRKRRARSPFTTEAKKETAMSEPECTADRSRRPERAAHRG
jgi:sRNA-binding protein